MAQLTATFEAGVNGNAITTAAGEASATAWDAVAGTLAYDTTHVAHGTLAGKVTSDGSYLAWTTAFGTPTDHYGRVCLYRTSLPTGGAALWQLVRVYQGASVAFGLYITSTGVVQVGDSTHSPGSGSVVVAANQWTRLEYHLVHSTTVGQIEVKLFNSLESSSPDETIGPFTSQNTLSNGNQIRFGRDTGGSTDSPGSIWLDDIVANATSYPGPAVVAGAPAKQAWRSRAFPSTLGAPRVI